LTDKNLEEVVLEEDLGRKQREGIRFSIGWVDIFFEWFVEDGENNLDKY
jgi:hypothetical protein